VMIGKVLAEVATQTIRSPLMPAEAGIQRLAKDWVPAFARTSGG